jgi:hypothetical protein
MIPALRTGDAGRTKPQSAKMKFGGPGGAKELRRAGEYRHFRDGARPQIKIVFGLPVKTASLGGHPLQIGRAERPERITRHGSPAREDDAARRDKPERNRFPYHRKGHGAVSSGTQPVPRAGNVLSIQCVCGAGRGKRGFRDNGEHENENAQMREEYAAFREYNCKRLNCFIPEPRLDWTE